MRRFARFPVGVSIAVVCGASLMFSGVGCRDASVPPPLANNAKPGQSSAMGGGGFDSGDSVWSTNPNVNRPQKPLLPEVAPTGPIGPKIVQLLPIDPLAKAPLVPAVVPGGDMLVVNGDTQRLFAIPTACAKWDRTGHDYALAFAPVGFQVTLTAERVWIATAARSEATFTVIFETAPGRGGWHGPLDAPTQRMYFQLPDGHSPEAIVALAAEEFSPVATDAGGPRFVYALGKSLVLGDVRETAESRDLGATFRTIAELPAAPKTLAFAGGDVFAVLPDSQILVLHETANFALESATKLDWLANLAGTDAATIGAIRTLTVLAPASQSVPARWLIHTATGTVCDGRFYAQPMALLPGGFIATLNAGTVEIRKSDAAPDSKALASLAGFPATADFFGADPNGASVVAVAGRHIYAAALNLADPAYQSGSENGEEPGD